MRRVVSVWLPTWPTDRLRRHRAGAVPPAEMPLVTAGHDGARRVVVAADRAARTLGLHLGMALAHAQAMLPHLAVAETDPAGDASALADLAAWCLRYAPLTAPDPPDGVWIDATGCAHLHGGEAAMLADLLGRLGRSGLAARAAVADTPGAAWAVARHGEDPAGIVAPGGQAEALVPLPVEALRLPPETAEGLRRLGLDRVGQLASTPRGPLARRFGAALLHRLDQALGHAPEPITPVLPPETIQHRLGFVEPLLTPEAFAAALAPLVWAVCTALEQAGQGARRLDLIFERVDGSVQAIGIGTARPARDPRHLGRLLEERLEAVDPGFGVEAMRLVATLAEPLAYAQASAPLAGDGETPPDLAALVDRLENRFGAHRVYRAAAVESDVPERSVLLVPGLAPVSAATWSPHLPRPVRLLDPPQPVEAMSLLPDHPPLAFTWRGVRRRVRHADGPERIAGEWWRRDGELRAVRDYWAVEDEAGRRYWLFRRGDGADPATGDLAWFLHGLF